MRKMDAYNLHNEDEVTVKKTGQIMEVIQVGVIYNENTPSKIGGVKVMLEDGNWYGHKEIK